MKCIKILWDFEIQMDQQILTKKPDQVVINKNIKKRERNDLVVIFPFWLIPNVKTKDGKEIDKY